MTQPVPILRPAPVLPAWVAASVDFAHAYNGSGAQIRLAITLAGLNVEHATGGPFGAAVFADGGRLVAVGVNRVEPLRSSLAHAEIVALVGAQRHVGRARLNAGGGHYTLATSAQPCCQCYGAIVWAGLSTLLIAARAEDTEALAGFDEGPLPADWAGELMRRGVRVVRDLERGAACAVLTRYQAGGGVPY
ncbi:MAG: nucleoside deaminase [Rhodanobacteraceae bacterium]|nr:MAG: nucleoside deaminase [Rhodanobacteraceae bacterium]